MVALARRVFMIASPTGGAGQSAGGTAEQTKRLPARTMHFAGCVRNLVTALRSAMLVLSLAAAGIAGLSWYFLRAPAAGAPAAPARVPAVPVVAGMAKRENVPIYLDGIGTVQASNTVTIRARVDGQIETIAFAEGQSVKAGDLLAQIDPRPYQAQLAQAQAAQARDEAQLTMAKLDFERVSKLAARDIAPRKSVESQEALVAQLAATVQGDQAAVGNARVQLEYTTITSPIDGQTGLRLIDQGNIVHANDNRGLVVITQHQPISVVFTLPQDMVNDVVAQMTRGSLKVLAFRRDEVAQVGEGVLAGLDNQVDQSTGTIRLKATFPNEANKLWPGQFVTARLLLATLPNVVTVPAPAVQRGPGGAYAYVIRADQTVEQRHVKVGLVRNDLAVIETGLTDGERVVIDGQYKVRAGLRVEVSPADTPRVAGNASL
jgi:multidrug efflux system membrane fusion protein